MQSKFSHHLLHSLFTVKALIATTLVSFIAFRTMSFVEKNTKILNFLFQAETVQIGGGRKLFDVVNVVEKEVPKFKVTAREYTLKLN